MAAGGPARWPAACPMALPTYLAVPPGDTRYRLLVRRRLTYAGVVCRPGQTLLVPRLATAVTLTGGADPPCRAADARTRRDVEIARLLSEA